MTTLKERMLEVMDKIKADHKAGKLTIQEARAAIRRLVAECEQERTNA